MRRFLQTHALMEGRGAESYFMMTSSPLFYKNFDIYVRVVSHLLEKKEFINILNIGFASATLEDILLDKFGKLIAISAIDISDTFHKLVNKKKYRERFGDRIKFIKANIEEKIEPFDKFDLIISRDLNHHLSSLLIYLRNSYNMLKQDGIMLMEDLRFDADIQGIKAFNDLIFSLPAFRNNNELLFHKMIGLYESFLSSFTFEEIEHELEKSDFYWVGEKSSSRYHFFLSKSKKINKRNKHFLRYLMSLYSNDAD